MAHSPGYPTDNNRQPDGKERSWEKQRGLQRGSWDKEALCLCKHNLYIKLQGFHLGLQPFLNPLLILH